MEDQRYILIGGPLDGVTQFHGAMVTFPDGEISLQAQGLRRGYRLWYRGVISFCGQPTKLYWEPGGWIPKTPLHALEDMLDAEENRQ
uniref:Uncharacterized protein n=1 Tax=viral metagenome TaxID=1070528 RepID=A0A6M3LVM5_9ZZZZ